MEVFRLDQLGSRLREEGIWQAFTPDVSRLTVWLWREIARGGPVSQERVEQIASARDLPQQTAREVLHKMCERDPDGNVVGITALSQNTHPHRFTVNGTRLSTFVNKQPIDQNARRSMPYPNEHQPSALPS